jgi:hypothetical protein
MSKLTGRIEEQEPDATPPAWEAAVRDVEEQGLALAVEAMHRTGCSIAAADAWLMKSWRSAPDQHERAIRAEALAHVRALAGRTLRVTVAA